jgi:single-strand DNA-binding protein
MSNGLNRVTLFGNLGSDPEIRITQGKNAVLKMRIATSDAYYDRDRKLVTRTEWHNVTVFGPRAEALAKILSKGDRVCVEGSLRYSSYERDGVTRYFTEIVARDIVLGGGRRRPPVAAEAGADLEMIEDIYVVDTSEMPASNASEPSLDAPGAMNGAPPPSRNGVVSTRPTEANPF